MKRFFYGVVFIVIGLPVFAGQKVIMIESTITGSQEQPKVITIVPWQQPREPEYFGEDITGVGVGASADVFLMIDRDAFNREMQYISSMRKAAQNN